MCHWSSLYHVYHNNNNNNFSIVSAYILFASYTCTLFCLQCFCKHYPYSLDLHNGDLQTLNLSSHKADWTTTDSLPALSCLLIYERLQSSKRSQSKRFTFSPIWELYSDRLYMCILIFVHHSCLLLLVYLEGVQCIY